MGAREGVSETTPHQKNRTVFLQGNTLLDEIVSLGQSTFMSTDPAGLHSHIHTESFEICFVGQGQVNWWVDTPKNNYHVERRSIFVTKPHQPHGGIDGMMHPCELYWIGVRLEAGRPLPGVSGGWSRDLYARYATLRTPTFPGTLATQELFDTLLEEHRRPRWSSVVKARSVLHLLLIEVIENYERSLSQVSSGGSQTKEIAEAVSWMNKNVMEPFTIDEVASLVNVSVSNFYRQFVDEMGVTPADYRNRIRIDRAKELLLQDETLSVTRIAHELGFSTSQYFSTVFKKYTGMSPTEYRRAGDLVPLAEEPVVYK